MVTPFLGEVRTFAFSFAPKAWAMCNGQQLSIAQNAALFSLLGTTFGGNGVTTFALPDLRGRTPLGQGTGPGLPSVNWGEVQGVESVTLNVTQIPQHNHLFTASSAPGTKKPLLNGLFADDVDTQAVDYFASPSAPGTSLLPLYQLSMAQAGSNQPHSNLQPYLVINFCIALQGIFPSRN